MEGSSEGDVLGEYLKNKEVLGVSLYRTSVELNVHTHQYDRLKATPHRS